MNLNAEHEARHDKFVARINQREKICLSTINGLFQALVFSTAWILAGNRPGPEINPQSYFVTAMVGMQFPPQKLPFSDFRFANTTGQMNISGLESISVDKYSDL